MAVVVVCVKPAKLGNQQMSGHHSDPVLSIFGESTVDRTRLFVYLFLQDSVSVWLNQVLKQRRAVFNTPDSDTAPPGGPV